MFAWSGTWIRRDLKALQYQASEVDESASRVQNGKRSPGFAQHDEPLSASEVLRNEDADAMTQTLASDEQLAAVFSNGRDELVRRAHRHTVSVQAWLSSRAPNAARFTGQGTMASSTGLGVSLLNLALGCRYENDRATALLADEIGAVQRFFAERKVPWSWWVGPLAQPADVGQHLERQGLQCVGKLPAMIAPLPVRGAWPPVDDRIWVRRAAGRADLQAASFIRRTAFQFPPGVAVDYFEAMAADWLQDSGRAELYVAGYEGQPPVAMGALIVGAGLPGVYVMATLPEHGRRGYGKAILRQILTLAAGQGHTSIVLTAGSKGYPLYKQFGFVHLFDYALYTLDGGA